MNKIEISEYSTHNRNEWEHFIDSSNNGTIFHKQAFLDYHKPGKFNFKHFIIRKNKEIIGVLPGGLTEDGKIFWSPVGASYGSIVTKDIHFELALNIVDSILEYFDKNSFKEIFLIPPPIVYNKIISQNLEYAMLYRKFDFELHYISHSIDISQLNGNPYAGCSLSTRNIIHKMLRENRLSIKDSTDYESFNKILIDNKARHNTVPTHSLEDMLKLQELLPNNIFLKMVELDGIPIAGGWFFKCNPQVLLCFYLMLDYNFSNERPIYFLLYNTIEYAIKNNFRWVDIGVSQDTSSPDPMTPSISLINFKEQFGARGILRSTFHYKFRD